MRPKQFGLSLVFLLILAVVVGCSSRPEDLSAEITFCRKVSRKSGRPIGKGEVFRPATKSYVHGLLDLDGMTSGRTYTLQLVWVRPDGRDLFSKYAEVVQQPLESTSGSSEYETSITWLDAVDLHKIKRDTLRSSDPDVRLKSRLNISSSRNREPGKYQLRVYFNRKFLLARDFTVAPDLDSTS